MPLVKLSGKCERSASPEPEQTEAPARQPMPLPVEDEPMAPGRPHQAFVEDEARKYWQEMVQPGSLTKPDRRQIREAAMPILVVALRRRTGSDLNPALTRARMAITAMQVHLAERGRLRRGYIRSENHPDFFEVLIQLSNDAGWLSWEIPLPFHRPPHHPPIHYEVDPRTEQPVPTDDSSILGDYVYYLHDGTQLTDDRLIRSWRNPYAHPTLNDLTTRGWRSCYALSTDRVGPRDSPWDPSSDRIRLKFFWVITLGHGSMLCEAIYREIYFSHPEP